MKLEEVMRELRSLGNAKTKATLQRHGAPDDIYGVKIGDLQKIVKKVKVDQALAEELFASGNSDAMYLAGLIADPQTVKPTVLKRWAKRSNWAMVSEYAVAGVAAESPHGWDLGLEWTAAKSEDIACIGWNTLAGVVSIRADEDLNLKKIASLLLQVKKGIQKAPNRVRYTMNGFVISVGCYVNSLSAKAREVAEAIGRVEVDMGDTACKVPFAPEYIDKVVKSGRLGKKRKKVRC